MKRKLSGLEYLYVNYLTSAPGCLSRLANMHHVQLYKETENADMFVEQCGWPKK